MSFSIKYYFISAILLVFLFNTQQGISQNTSNVEASPSVNRLMMRYVENAKSKDVVKVWRIQILSTSDRREMETALANFKAVYPEMIVDWKHVSPNYQVRAGYFENKNRLMPLMLEIKKSFPSATPVYDNVSKKSILGF